MLKKLTNKTGFTLMEMLIVVAIIAILVAIAIPTFNSSLNKARVATDEANLRAAYAEQMVAFMDAVSDGTTNPTITDKEVVMTGTPAADVKIADITVSKWTAGDTMLVKVSADGKAEIVKKP